MIRSNCSCNSVLNMSGEWCFTYFLITIRFKWTHNLTFLVSWIADLCFKYLRISRLNNKITIFKYAIKRRKRFTSCHLLFKKSGHVYARRLRGNWKLSTWYMHNLIILLHTSNYHTNTHWNLTCEEYSAFSFLLSILVHNNKFNTRVRFETAYRLLFAFTFKYKHALAHQSLTILLCH